MKYIYVSVFVLIHAYWKVDKENGEPTDAPTMTISFFTGTSSAIFLDNQIGLVSDDMQESSKFDRGASTGTVSIQLDEKPSTYNLSVRPVGEAGNITYRVKEKLLVSYRQ